MLKLHDIRIKSGKTTNQVATDLNINLNTYLGYEAGRRTPDLNTIKRIANYFGVSIDYMVDYYGNITIQDLQIIYNSLPPNDQKVLLEFASFLQHKNNKK